MNIEKLQKNADIFRNYNTEGLSPDYIADFIEKNHQKIMKQKYKISVKLKRNGMNFYGSYLGNNILIKVSENIVELWAKLSFLLKPMINKVSKEFDSLARELINQSKH